MKKITLLMGWFTFFFILYTYCKNQNNTLLFIVLAWAIATLFGMIRHLEKVLGIKNQRNKNTGVRSKKGERAILCLETLNQQQFTELVMYMLTQKGYTIILSKLQGVFRVEKENKCWDVVIEYSLKEVNESMINNNILYKRRENKSSKIMITNHHFTPQAIIAAKYMKFQLIDGNKIVQILHQLATM